MARKEKREKTMSVYRVYPRIMHDAAKDNHDQSQDGIAYREKGYLFDESILKFSGRNLSIAHNIIVNFHT